MHKTQTSRHSNRPQNLLRMHGDRPGPPLPVQRIYRLLDVERVDLSQIVPEVRLHSDLESLLLRMAISLELSPVDSRRTLEDALVALGADRVRILLYTWSLLRHKSAETDPPSVPAGWSPEALYLASFLRYLGLDSPEAEILHAEMFSFTLDRQRAEFADLRDTLMRDFFALLPVLDPSILRFAPAAPAKT